MTEKNRYNKMYKPAGYYEGRALKMRAGRFMIYQEGTVHYEKKKSTYDFAGGNTVGNNCAQRVRY